LSHSNYRRLCQLPFNRRPLDCEFVLWLCTTHDANIARYPQDRQTDRHGAAGSRGIAERAVTVAELSRRRTYVADL